MRIRRSFEVKARVTFQDRQQLAKLAAREYRSRADAAGMLIEVGLCLYRRRGATADLAEMLRADGVIPTGVLRRRDRPEGATRALAGARSSQGEPSAPQAQPRQRSVQ